MSELEPKPCPFCGSRAKVEEMYLWNEPLYQVRCRSEQRDCPVSPATPFDYTTEEQAILVWNRRADA